MDFLKNEVLEFVKSQADKLLLAALLVFMVSMLLHLVHHENSSPVIPWVEKSADMLLGSLLTLITGQVFRKASEGK